ncbi:MAG: hypothetical protein ABUK01_00175 [Leptospirales bacterium]
MSMWDFLNALKKEDQKESSRGSKIFILVITVFVSFVPFFFVITNLKKTMGDNPRALTASISFMVFLALGLIFIILKSKPNK